jgi:hypothetical protein
MGLPTLIVGYECTKRTVRTDGPHQITDIIILPAYQWIPRLWSEEDFGISRPKQRSYSHTYAEASLNAVHVFLCFSIGPFLAGCSTTSCVRLLTHFR